MRVGGGWERCGATWSQGACFPCTSLQGPGRGPKPARTEEGHQGEQGLPAPEGTAQLTSQHFWVVEGPAQGQWELGGRKPWSFDKDLTTHQDQCHSHPSHGRQSEAPRR